MTRHVRLKTFVAVLAAGSLVFAACGSDDKKDASGPELTALGKTLPDSIQKSGVLRVGSDIEYPPMEFFKEGTKVVQGLDYELGQALGKKLGVTVKFTNDTDFGGIILSMNQGRFDIIMSSMTDTKERQGGVVDGKKTSDGADFVDYFVAGSSMIVPKGNPKGFKTINDLCGHNVSVQNATIQDTDIVTPLEQTCNDAGKPINVLRQEKDALALQLVKAGQSDANIEDYPVALYNSITSGGGKDFDAVGEQIGSAPIGIAVPKTQTALRDALQTALKALIADGSYDTILAKWKAEAGALKTAPINSGT